MTKADCVAQWERLDADLIWVCTNLRFKTFRSMIERHLVWSRCRVVLANSTVAYADEIGVFNGVGASPWHVSIA